MLSPGDPKVLPPTRIERQRQLGRIILELIETILLSVFLFLVINAATSRIQVESISMQPTLYERDRVLVNRLAYKFGQPHRKEIIVFMPPLDGVEEPYIKRLIGLPGDKIRILNRQVIVNGEPIEETYLMAPPDYVGSWEVPPGYLFVLGDNRNQSSNSHYWGMVPIQNVLGKAEFIYWPATRIKLLDPVRSAAAQQINP